MRSWKNVESTESSFTCWRADLASMSVAAAFLAAFIILIGACLAGGNCQAHAQGVASPVPMPLLPSSVAFDIAGNLYFSDTNRNVVYESSLAGVLSVIAGNSVQGFSGDGGGATSAELNAPQGVAIGPNGTLYIADTGNQRIRAVSAGIISTFAGTGNPGFAGDGGQATSAMLRNPNALAIDASGALLICDSGNQRVRRVSVGLIETIVGNGTQGFAGDGGAAMNAELDTPMGLADAPDGRIFVADSHNQRIRVMALNGVISTLAGNGTNGYSGDGGPATIAELSLPRGLIVTASGAVIFADSNNQRIRMVDALGTITTIAGSGLQGQASDGTAALTASLNSPRGVAVSSFGAPVFADALSNLVRESVTDGNVYVPAGLAPNRISLVTLNASFNNGQTDATVSVASRAGAPQGVVVLLDGTSLITQATLVNGAATFSAQLLSPGTHVLTAAYLGDGVNPAATSAATSIDSGTGVITATANPVNIQYGQAIPPLTGSLEGEPAQGVFASFTTTAAALSPVGTYPITASLSGPASANYTLVMSPQSGALQIAQATSITAIQPVTQNSYAGLPLLLNASVASITEGSPTGMVTFADNGSPVASAMLVSGDATGTYISPVAGQHTIVATYAGDRNFLPSVSQSETVTVAAMPDFSMLASGSTTQTVAGGEVATYGMTIAPQMGSFTGAVDFSATGLPAGATASFSPPQIVPGTSSVNVLMSVQTSATLLARTQDLSIYVTLAGLLVPLWIFAFKRRKTMRWIPICSLIVMLECLAGCGARTVSTVLQGGKTYTLTVSGTSTNLAGAVVSHSTQVTLVVE